MHIVLSPHFDDAALSCGGLIAKLSSAAEPVEVATIFGGKPDYAQLSPFARMIHGRPLAGQDPVEQRYAEERRALAILGATGRPGDYLDCIYRQDADKTRWLYASEEALFGPVDPAEDGLVEELAHCMAALALPAGACTLYAPLAIGNHVDHQLVRRSAELLQRHGHTVCYYEDYPYIARNPAGLEASLCSSAPRERWQAELVWLSPAELACKAEAVLAYSSQLGVLFPGNDAPSTRVSAALSAHAWQTGGTNPAERLWRLREQV